jgi:hypothetical protein
MATQAPAHLTEGTRLVHSEDDMLTTYENDLVDKAKAIFEKSKLAATVLGIFSLDDLSGKLESELGNQIGVGCGYIKCEPANSADVPTATVDRSQKVQMLAFEFMVILAVPVDEAGELRHNATTLLTLLRKGIAGQEIAGDRTSRTWTFVSEAPRIAESSDTLLYYAQVWRVVTPLVANQPA